MSNNNSENSIFSSTGHWATVNRGTASDPMAGFRHMSTSLVQFLVIRSPLEVLPPSAPLIDAPAEFPIEPSPGLFGTHVREAVRVLFKHGR